MQINQMRLSITITCHHLKYAHRKLRHIKICIISNLSVRMKNVSTKIITHMDLNFISQIVFLQDSNNIIQCYIRLRKNVKLK